jgi:glycosyl transferase, family 25
MNLDFQKIGVWLINLPANQDRLEKMARQLDAMGLPWKLFVAVNGKERYEELIAKADPAAYANNMGSPILPGKLGVYASHKGVWEAFLETDFEHALIFEDDVVFHEDFLQALSAAHQASAHWDIVRFNCVRAKIPVTQGLVGRWRLNAYIGPFTGNAAYMIRKDIAAKLIANIGPQTRALDHELNRFFHHDYRLLGMEPWASHTDDGNVSTITGVAFSSVKKFKWYKRLPHYRLKAANYFRRFFWLIKNGMAFPISKKLIDEEQL